MTRHDMTTASMITCAGCKHSYADSALFCPNCGTPKARDAAPMDALVGKVLGDRFQVLELIGQGGSGSIYRAEHVTLRRKVAIKVLHNELSRDDLAVERFRREATTVAEIDNEHIVEIHDFGRTHDGRLYLAMELLEGETLDNVLAREKQLSVERATDILIQVGEALMEAHAIGYVHRDLRPRNIYLAVRRGKANFVKLLDFGLAKLVDTDAQAASTSLGMTFGDPRYMSPEQARGDRIDRRADIYQLGCIAYEMLSGAPPFTGNRVFDILSKQVTEVPAPLPTRRAGIPLWLEAAVAKMLAKDAENRFATTTRMVEALRLGLETGQVMEDEIARRRESIPPPSVSRVMQKMGMSTPADPPAHPQVAGNATMKGHLEGPGAGLPPALANPPVTGKETLRGHLEGPLGSAAAVTEQPQRRRTGTPNLGVPVQPPVAGFIDRSTFADGFANHHASQPTSSIQVASGAHASPPSQPAVHGPPVMPPQAPIAPSAPSTPAPPSAPVITPSAPIPALVTPAGSAPVASPPSTSSSASRSEPAPAGRSKRSSHQPGPSESSAWFDDGERASEEAEKIRARKVISPSSTDMSLYDEPPRRRLWPIALISVLALGAVVAIVVVASGGKSKSPAPQAEPVATAPETPPPTDVPPSQIISPDGSAAVPPPATGSAATPPPVPPTTQVTKSNEPAKSSTRKSSSSSSSSNVGKTAETDTASRRPSGGGWFDPPAPTTTPAKTPDPTPVPVPTPTPTPTPSGVSGSEGPVDPYGGNDTPPADSAAPEKKSEFFANLGKQQLASGDTAGAAASFKKALELDAKNVAAVIGMGEIALRQGLFGDAIAHLKKATKLAPKSSYVWTLLGEAYLGTNNNSVAADTFKKALQLDPDNTRAREGFDEAQSKVPPATDD
jgi:serine/threonine-protein kinase